LIVSVCEALQYAHGEGVVHRDIKPANVLVDTKGRVKVADFGLARMDTPSAEQWGQTMTGMVLGTPDYMAPEQKSGSRVDHRADIYSLGVMLYEMLCGQIPQGIFDPPSMRVAVDDRVDQVVIRAMQQEPDRRYANTGEMKSEVEIIRQTPLPKTPSSATAGKAQAATTPVSVKGATGVPSQVTEPPPSQVQVVREKSITPWLAGIAALCAVVAVSVVLIQMMRSPARVAGPVVPPPAPELAPIKSATAAPEAAPEKAAAPADKKEALAATPEPVLAKTEPPAPATTPSPKPDSASEPPAPVAPPPSEPPVAVTTLPGPRVPQIIPSSGATTGIVPVAPGSASSGFPAAQSSSDTTAPAPEAPPTEGDWHTLVTQGDRLMDRRQRDDAMDAYLNAFDLASDGRAVGAAELASLCKKVASLQMSFGSLAEARQTLEKGRQSLKKMTGGKDAGDRQRYLDQIENTIRSLPRD
jgi:serine/threonine protein kinase